MLLPFVLGRPVVVVVDGRPVVVEVVDGRLVELFVGRSDMVGRLVVLGRVVLLVVGRLVELVVGRVVVEGRVEAPSLPLKLDVVLGLLLEPPPAPATLAAFLLKGCCCARLLKEPGVLLPLRLTDAT